MTIAERRQNHHLFCASDAVAAGTFLFSLRRSPSIRCTARVPCVSPSHGWCVPGGADGPRRMISRPLPWAGGVLVKRPPSVQPFPLCGPAHNQFHPIIVMSVRHNDPKAVLWKSGSPTNEADSLLQRFTEYCYSFA